MAETTASMTELLREMGQRARRASYAIAALPPAVKNDALERMAASFDANRERIKTENAKDLAAGEKNGLTPAMIDRLRLDDKGIDGLMRATREIAALPDPVGAIENMAVRPNGLQIGQVRAPIGVVGMIYESRPNVTLDAGALCLKSGNAAILRGGSEAFHSNTILATLMEEACRAAGIPEGAVQLIPTTDREAVGAMLKAEGLIDLIIPRGGKNLIRRVTQESVIPVIKHLDGNCTVYVDEFAELPMALDITINSKTHRYGVCNAAETLLVHAAVADKFLPLVLEALHAKDVRLHGCPRTMAAASYVEAATEEDWYAEYLAPEMAVKVVDSFDDAVEFINHYGSHHTESIVTRDMVRAQAFVRRVDSACVHVNCSTRFSDGGEYGLGAEIGISTDKLHARGPMGLRELTTAKWVVLGSGQTR
ncbi:MAG: glutamate-5-semialdehyde dehydrogenase [Candidatus Sumerlaeota bacterium]|nr:glutamate-5-semialdehyde dehydrogenase [Candidatus Sumerlaeota bacterium]